MPFAGAQWAVSCRDFLLACRLGPGVLFAACGGRGLDLDFRPVRKRVAARRDDGIVFLDAGRDFGKLLVADADFDFRKMRFVVGPGEQHVIVAFGRFVDRRCGNDQRLINTLCRDGDLDIHSRLQCRPRLERFNPDFDGGAAGIQRRADEHDAPLYRLLNARQLQLRGVVHLQKNRFVLRDVRLGD